MSHREWWRGAGLEIPSDCLNYPRLNIGWYDLRTLNGSLSNQPMRSWCYGAQWDTQSCWSWCFQQCATKTKTKKKRGQRNQWILEVICAHVPASHCRNKTASAFIFFVFFLACSLVLYRLIFYLLSRSIQSGPLHHIEDRTYYTRNGFKLGGNVGICCQVRKSHEEKKGNSAVKSLFSEFV